MDTVWLRLTNRDSEEVYIMFGPGGVTNFQKGDDDLTMLFSAHKCVGTVKEEPAYIINTIGAIRGTIKGKNATRGNRKKGKRVTS